MSMHIETHTVIIGAGLTGLTLAHSLKRKGQDFLVLERSEKTGGVINTVQRDGFLFETGPNTGVLGNEQVMDLFDELAPFCKLEVAGEKVNKRYVLKNGLWEPMPGGLLGGITTPLFSFGDKLRILGEPFRKPGTNPNETLDQLVKRRMGQSFLDYAVDPFILGIYAGDPSYLVPKYALPKLYNLEQKYGSFIGGQMKMAREKKRLGIKTRATRKIFSVEGGLANLTSALLESAGKERFITSVGEIVIEPSINGFVVRGIYKGDGFSVKAKQVVTTASAHELPEIIPFVEEPFLKPIVNLKYARVVQISLGFNKWNGFRLDGFGGLIPHREKREILGVLFPSAFLKNRAPEGGALLSVFMGGMRNDEIFDFSDHAITEIVKREISDLMNLNNFKPDLINISRYRYAIPQYGADCEARFNSVAAVQSKYPGLVIAGNLRNGIGMADRIKQAIDLADELMAVK